MQKMSPVPQALQKRTAKGIISSSKKKIYEQHLKEEKKKVENFSFL